MVKYLKVLEVTIRLVKKYMRAKEIFLLHKIIFRNENRIFVSFRNLIP